MNLKSIATIAATVIAGSAWAAGSVGTTHVSASCGKKETQSAGGGKDTACSKKETSCSKKETSCSKK